MFELLRILVLTLLFGGIVSAYHDSSDSHHLRSQVYDTRTSANPTSEEDISFHLLDLEDVGISNADEEELNEDYSDYRRKRSLDTTPEEGTSQDVEVNTNEPEEEHEATDFSEEVMESAQAAPTFLPGQFDSAHHEESDNQHVSVEGNDRETSQSTLSGEDMPEHHHSSDEPRADEEVLEEDYSEYSRKMSLDTTKEPTLQSVREDMSEHHHSSGEQRVDEELLEEDYSEDRRKRSLDIMDEPVLQNVRDNIPEHHHSSGEKKVDEELLEGDYSEDRRKRSVDKTKQFTLKNDEDITTVKTVNKPEEGKITSDFSNEDMEAAETAIFMPAHLRLKKKRAIEECREKNRQFVKEHRANPQRLARWLCNDYCCYYVKV